ncbi:HEAT repeat domain-containing protein [Streptomyces umbrinus]|uniref:HEAT repeat domain-containing protein n=1 Tax=Streptomyces umbrinus TaxID=67370 RepID=UPI0033DD0C4F
MHDAGLGLREISELLMQMQQKSLPGTDTDTRQTRQFSVSKSHLGRVVKGEVLPNPLRQFTLLFLKVTSRAANLSQEAHSHRWAQAKTLIEAIEDSHVQQQALIASRGSSPVSTDDKTIVALRLEVDLERALHTETRLRYALRDAHVLMTTLLHIISALRDLISNQHRREAHALHGNGDPAELTRVKDETQQALEHKRVAHEEAERAAARISALDTLWDQARGELHRLSLSPEFTELALLTSDAGAPVTPVRPQDLLTQLALDDIAAALSKARDLNNEEEQRAIELQQTLVPDGPLQPQDELAILVASTRLSDPRFRRTALDGLIKDWEHHPDTRGVLLRLTRDAHPDIRSLAVDVVARNWWRDVEVWEALVRVACEDEDRRVQVQAVRELATYRPGDTELGDMLLSLTCDDNPGVRGAAAEGLARSWLGEARIREALLHLVHDDDDDDVRVDVLHGIARGWRGEADIREALLRCVRDRADDIRFAAVAGLVGARSGYAQLGDDVLALIFDDDDEEVRRSAESVLIELWPVAPVAREALLRRVPDDHRARTIAAKWLAEWGPYDDAARDALLHATRDEDKAVRHMAAETLVRNWPGETVIRDALIRLTHDSDQSVRRSASRWLQAGWPNVC